MRPDEIRNVFESVEAQPSAQFAEALHARLRAEFLRTGLDPSRDAEHLTLEPILIDVLQDEPGVSCGGRPERPNRRWSRRRIAVAVAASVIVATTVVVRTAQNDDVEIIGPARPGPVSPVDPAVSGASLPDGLHGLPPEGAPPSTPEIGQLVAELPMPIWVYEDGRVISARWTTPYDWTGFLEQRLTPEGVDLVRTEILASNASQNACSPGRGGYAYSDGGLGPAARTVCEYPLDGNPRDWEEVYPRLWELPYGARSWLPASAWADPEPKPYVPSTYTVWISEARGADEGPRPPIDPAAVLGDLPPEAADLLAAAAHCNVDLLGPVSLCSKLGTAQARQLATALGMMTVQTENDVGSDSGVLGAQRWGYLITFLPDLPHAPVSCCAG